MDRQLTSVFFKSSLSCDAKNKSTLLRTIHFYGLLHTSLTTVVCTIAVCG